MILRMESEVGTQARGKEKARDRRKWTKQEEEYLIEILEDLVRCGYSRDNGFKSGTHVKVEKKFEERLIGCGIKANPHIESKMKVLKKHYLLVTDMLGHTRFGWNETLKCVEVDTDDQWESYLNVYALLFRKLYIYIYLNESIT